MRIGFYNPYFDAFGGGERYCLSLASHWAKLHAVDIFWDNTEMLSEAEKRFHIDLSKVQTVPNIFRYPIIRKLFASYAYDVIFFLSDGSIPISFAGRNILHFQQPFAHVPINTLRLRRYQAIVCNSLFTRSHIDSRIQKFCDVIYPPVAVSRYCAREKEKTILSVGRFSGYHQVKKQHVLIEVWKKMYQKKEWKGWKLLLAGGLLPSDRAYFQSLVGQGQGISVSFQPNISFEDLKILYGNATFYWHAAGFHENDPVYMEHFGISTVEAMASGCIPIVYQGGGQPEIVREGVDGFLWKDTEELIEKTERVKKNAVQLTKLQKAVVQRAAVFSEQSFFDAFDNLLKRIIT